MRNKLLIIDDSASIRALVKLLLGTEFDYAEAVDGQDGCSKALSEKPQLILLDVQMPVRNGVEALRVLRDDAATRNIPVVMVSTLSNNEGDENIATCRKIGVNGVLPKPIMRDPLAKMVHEILATKREA